MSRVAAALLTLGLVGAAALPSGQRGPGTLGGTDTAQAEVQRPPVVLAKAPEAPPPEPKVVLLSVPQDAYAAAARDLATVPEFDRPFVRYIWVQSGEDEDVQALNFVLNLASLGSTIFLPVQTGGILVRIDLRWMIATADDFEKVLELWEALAFDPTFSRLYHGQTLLALDPETPVPWLKRRWVKDGNQWLLASRELTTKRCGDLVDPVVVRLNVPVLEPLQSELQAAMATLAPVVDSRYLTGRLTSTIKDRDVVQGKERENLFSIVWGGLYYEFAGIRKSATKGVTDLQQLLIDMGIGSKDEPFEKFFERLRSDERLAMYRSDVTGKPRRVVWVGTPNSRLSAANGVVFITEDLRNRDVERGSDPTANLVNFTPRAYEVIWTRRNGHLGYAIFGENQELLEKAAAEVVVDHTVPPPNTSELQGPISCLRCHGPHDGWQPLRNEVRELVPLVVGDLTKKRSLKDIHAAADLQDRLKGWYYGDAKGPLFIARMQNAKAVLRTTGKWKGEDATKVAQLASARVGKVFAEDRYNAIDAKEAARRLGLAANTDAFLKAVSIDEKRLEDSVVLGLANGYRVTTYQWALSYGFLLERIKR